MEVSALDYRAARERLGLSQAALAARLGLSRETINKRESGYVPISKEAWCAIQYLHNNKSTNAEGNGK